MILPNWFSLTVMPDFLVVPWHVFLIDLFLLTRRSLFTIQSTRGTRTGTGSISRVSMVLVVFWTFLGSQGIEECACSILLVSLWFLNTSTSGGKSCNAGSILSCFSSESLV